MLPLEIRSITGNSGVVTENQFKDWLNDNGYDIDDVMYVLHVDEDTIIEEYCSNKGDDYELFYEDLFNRVRWYFEELEDVVTRLVMKQDEHGYKKYSRLKAAEKLIELKKTYLDEF